MPASSAMLRTVVAWKPFSAKSSAASLTRCSRRSEASAGDPFARALPPDRPLFVLVVVTYFIMPLLSTACSVRALSLGYGFDQALANSLRWFFRRHGAHRPPA